MTNPTDLTALIERVENEGGAIARIFARLDRSGPCWNWICLSG